MKKYAQLSFVLLMLIFSGFQCEEEYVNALSIIEGHTISCADRDIDKIYVVTNSNNNLLAIDSLFPDSEGFFTHQFTSISSVFYLVPATQECSSVLTFIPTGKKTELDLMQTPLFQALDINFNIDPTQVDSLRVRITAVREVVNNEGEIVYNDPQNFDSGYTTQWDTLQTAFILGEGRSYNFVTEIFPKSGSPSVKTENLIIFNQPIVRTITL